MHKLSVSKFIIFLFAIAILASCSKNNIVIKGKIENWKSNSIYLLDYDLLSYKILDSAKIKSDGSFKFKIKSTETRFLQLSLSPKNFILLLANPGERINVKGDANALAYNYSVEGSEGTSQVKALTDNLNKSLETMDSILAIYSQNKNKKNFDTLYAKLNQQYTQTIKDQRRYSIKFIIEHLHSMASIVALYQKMNDTTFVLNQNRDLQYVKLLSDTLSKYYPNSKIVKALNNDRSRLMTAYNSLKLSSMASSVKTVAFPEIVLPDIQGRNIELSKIKSKCILLFFWNGASEDDYIILRGLKEIYKKYHSKGFEIYSVAFIEDEKSWIGFVTKNKLVGINVIDKSTENSINARNYNLSKVPETFLIGPNSDIVARSIFGENLENKIKEILSKK